MTPERWNRIDELFHEADSLPPSERAAFLRAACPDDDTVRREVESLLNEATGDGGLLGRSLPAMGAQFTPALGASDLKGRSIGGYQLQELLGAGGMGEVYRAHDARLGRDVAIKILPSAFMNDPDRLARLEREARMLASVNHPGICAIYGIEEADGIRLLVLEVVEGETLADKLAERLQSAGAGLPLGNALAIARQIAEALEFAHEKGIIHRDLKPANIKVTPDGAVKVLDFGLAKAVDGEGSAPGLTRAPASTAAGKRGGILMGTAAYMSPEQARGLAVDRRTDIWAFGCVLYEMLTGRVAFAGDTASDSIAKVLEREPDWSALPASVPTAIRRLLFRSLAKDPKKRLRDIGDVRIEIDALDEVLPGVPGSPTRTLRPWLTALGLAVVGLSLLAAVVRWPTPASIDARLATARYTQITEWEGAELDAAISRDGRFVAFIGDRAGPFHTFLTQVGTGAIRDLSSDTDDERNPLNRPVGFSADGSELFLSGSPISGRRLRTMPFTGGASRLFLEERAISMAWSPDGARLVYFTAAAADGDTLFVADRTGANAQRILAGNGEHNHFPTWSQDGRWIYYVHFSEAPDLADLWRIPATGGTPERLTEQYTDARYPTPIDDEVLYVAHAEDRSGPWLWSVDVARKKAPRRVTGVGPDRYLSLAASADGGRLVTAVGTSTATLWGVTIGSAVAGESDATRYPLSAARALAPRFARRALFYLGSSGSGDGLWRMQDRNAVEIWKPSDGGLLGPAAVSTDGQVAVTLRTKDTARLVVVSADGAVRRSVADGIHVRGTAGWSPDGKWIVTGGKDAHGAPGLFKVPADGGGAPFRLVTGQAVDPVWSPNGNLIVYAGPLAKGSSPVLGVDPDGRPVTLPPIRTGAPGGDCGGCLRFLPDGTGLVYILGETGAQGFWLLELRTNTFRPLARLASPAATRTFDITPDGRQIVFDRLREKADIVVIDLPKR